MSRRGTDRTSCGPLAVLKRVRILRRLLGAALALGLVATGLLAPPPAHATGRRLITVMTRNLSLGATLAPAIGATSVPALLAAPAHIFSVVQQTNFPERAKALARDIADADPVLLGVQEA